MMIGQNTPLMPVMVMVIMMTMIKMMRRSFLVVICQNTILDGDSDSNNDEIDHVYNKNDTFPNIH